MIHVENVPALSDPESVDAGLLSDPHGGGGNRGNAPSNRDKPYIKLWSELTGKLKNQMRGK